MNNTIAHFALLFVFIVFSINLFGSDKALKSDTTQMISEIDNAILSGAITIYKEDFNPGYYTNPLMLIQGKVAGLNIQANDGSANSPISITNQGINSFSFRNGTPLIVVDGVPLYDTPLNLNSEDIERFTILQDAAASGFYSDKPNGGAILISTKKGAQTTKVSYSGKFIVSQLSNDYNLLSAQEYRNIINEHYDYGPKAIEMLGNTNTNWIDEIFTTGIGHDHHLSASGTIKSLSVPYRLSVGRTDLDGILKGDQFNRTAPRLSLHPRWFNNRLKIDVSASGIWEKNKPASIEAINIATHMNPTVPVYDENGDYYKQLYYEANPIQELEENLTNNELNQTVIFFKADYSLKSFPELSFGLLSNLSAYSSKSLNLNHVNISKTKNLYNKSSRFNQFHIQFQKQFQNKHSIKAQVSYRSYSKVTDGNYYLWSDYGISLDEALENGFRNGSQSNFNYRGYKQRALLANISYDINNKYYFNLSLRHEGKASLSNAYKYTPYASIEANWKLHNESFLSNADFINRLNLRASFGKSSDWDQSQVDSYYSSEWDINQPSILPSTLKPETYTNFTLGLYFSLFSNKLSGRLNYFSKKGNDLVIPVSLNYSSGYSASYINIADLKSHGFDFSFNYTAIQTTNTVWKVYMNLSSSKNKVFGIPTAYSFISDLNERVIPGLQNASSIINNNSSYPIFYLLQQLYDSEGSPIEGAYLNTDKYESIDERDAYPHLSPTPTLLASMGSSLSFEKWTLSIMGRYLDGNHVYNSFDYWSNLTNLSVINGTRSYLQSNFTEKQRSNDYYVQDASFFKLDYISMNYNFGKIWQSHLGLKLSFVVQNAITITKYSGQDPEHVDGIDFNKYPRSRAYILKVEMDL